VLVAIEPPVLYEMVEESRMKKSTFIMFREKKKNNYEKLYTETHLRDDANDTLLRNQHFYNRSLIIPQFVKNSYFYSITLIDVRYENVANLEHYGQVRDTCANSSQLDINDMLR
jgi:hypothetical protein